MDRLQKYIDAFASLPEDCREAELNAVFTEDVTAQYRRGDPEQCGAYEKNALFLRAAADGTGTVYTEDLNDDPRRLIALALENARSLDSPIRQPMRHGGCEQVAPERAAEADVQAIVAFAEGASALPGVERCTVSRTARHCRVINSYGLDTSLENVLYTVELEVYGKGEDNFKCVSRSAASLADIDIDAMLARIRHEELLDHSELPYISLPAGTYDAVISANMTVNIMNTAWQLFAKRLMQNGRSSFQPGEAVGSSAFNVVDAAVCPYTGYDFSIDAEGIMGPSRLQVVRNGVIESPLATLSEDQSTGHAGRDDLLSGVLHMELIPIPRNLWIDGGQDAPEELIQRMGTGIHLTYSLDEYHSTNPASGTFSIPCGGVYYKDGKPVGRLQQMNLYGGFKELFRAIEACGNDISMKPMDTYNSYCFGGPSLLARGLRFAM